MWRLTVIMDLDLSVRASNVTHQAGINTLGELAELTLREVEAIRNMGVVTLMELDDAIKRVAGFHVWERDPAVFGDCLPVCPFSEFENN